MAGTRVLVFPMHEEERDAAAAVMAEAEVTDAVVYGELDDTQIANLRERGIIVQVLEPTERPAPAPPVARTFSRPGRSLAPGTPGGLCRLRLKGPLLPARRQLLDGLGVEIIEALPGFALRARVPSEALDAVNQLPWMAEPAELLGGAPATLRTFGPAAGVLPPREVVVRPYDVVLHDPTALAPFLEWLRERPQAVVGPARGAKARVHLPEGSPMIDDIGDQVQWVANIEEYVAPELHNDVSRVLLGLEAAAGPATSTPLEGEGETTGVADTGIDHEHPDFAGRIVGRVALGRPGDTSDPHGHGTHVAGSVLGDGTASSGKLRGVAPRARLFFQSLLDPDGGLGGLPFQLEELFEEAYQAGVRVHNNSWGAATEAQYRITSNEVDDFVCQRRDMLIVISAGNSGSAADPGIGQRNAQPGFVDWLSIGSPATCKNALTVGASRSGRTTGGMAERTYGEVWPEAFPDPPISATLVSADATGIGGFSSRGPCNDYRIKPDVVAPGTDIVSCRSNRAPLRNFWGPDPHNPQYAFMGGTSMAAPLVSGCAALVREYYVGKRAFLPSAALLKATLINGTRWLGAADAVADYPDRPNYHQGFGCLHMPSTIPTGADPGFTLSFVDNWTDPSSHFGPNGGRRRFEIDVAGGPIRMCLAYTDPPGRSIQNDLHLLVQVPGTPRKRFGNEHVPRGFNGSDPTNNVEVLTIDPAPAGRYLVQVSAATILKPPQDFALVVTGNLTSDLRPV